MGKAILWLALCAICLSGCYTQLPVLAVRVENDQYRFEKRCRAVEKEIKGNVITVNVCTVTRVPTHTPDFNPITAAQIQSVVDSTNGVWSKYDYKFSFDEKLDYVTWHSSRLNKTPTSMPEWDEYARLGNALALLSDPQQDKVVVLFRGEGGYGWSWGPDTTNYISMPGDGFPRNKFLEHEVGHYFGLVHTFNFDDCSKVTLANTDNDRDGMLPGVTDDDILDTAGDPTKKCLSANFCNQSSVTINGIIFSPPLHNVMSYLGCPPIELTPDQLRAIKHNLLHGRSSIPIRRFTGP